MIPDLIAQLAQTALPAAQELPWVQFGLAGMVIYWLMHKHDRGITDLRKDVQSAAAASQQSTYELKQAITDSGAKVEHKITGLSRTMLIDLIERKELSEQGRRLAQIELDKTNAPFQRRDT